MSWPTTNNPRTEFVTLRLTVDEAAELDWLKGRVNAKDRSSTLRQSLMRVSAAERKRERKETQAGSMSEGQHADD